MALNRKQIILLFLVSILTGCGQDSERINQLEIENAKLQFKLDQHEAEIKYMDDQAAIAAGCDLFVEFCPNSMTRSGHDAIKQGYSGAGNDWFWLAFIGKFVVLGAGFAALWISIVLARIRLLLPAQKKVRECLEIIDEAEQREEQADRNVQYAYQRLGELNEKIMMAQTELKLVEQNLQKARKNVNSQNVIDDAHQNIKRTLDEI